MIYVFIPAQPTYQPHRRVFFQFCVSLLQVEPAPIVDMTISFWVAIWTPREFRTQLERASLEFDIRSFLREWDREFPLIRHERIVRYMCGAVASVCYTSLYKVLKQGDTPRLVLFWYAPR